MFVGREAELYMLRTLESRDGVKTCMIVGRRRIGKSELIGQFCSDRRSISFEFAIGALDSQLRYMADVLTESTGVPREPYSSMYSCLRDIASVCREARTIVVFDEFQYLVADDKNNAISSELQRFVDTLLDGTETMVIICGSQTSMMRELTSDPRRPLFGRFPETIELKPLSLQECALLHPTMTELDQLRLYITVGGIPAFHNPDRGSTYEDFIWESFMRDQAPLQEEALLLIGSGSPVDERDRKIIRVISEGAVTNKMISEKTGTDKDTCSARLKAMVELGILGRLNPMYGAPKQPRYYIKEDAVAFYYGVYESNRARIDPRRKEETMKKLRDGISSFLGRRFERVCEDYLRKHWYCLETGRWWGPSDEIGEDGKPVIVDIDITARISQGDSEFDVFCECKMRRRPAGFTELNTLVERVAFTKQNENPRYVLFSVGGFTEDLEDYAGTRADVDLVDLEDIVRDTPPGSRGTS